MLFVSSRSIVLRYLHAALQKVTHFRRFLVGVIIDYVSLLVCVFVLVCLRGPGAAILLCLYLVSVDFSLLIRLNHGQQQHLPWKHLIVKQVVHLNYAFLAVVEKIFREYLNAALT